MKETILFTLYSFLMLALGYMSASEDRKIEAHYKQIDSLQVELFNAQNNVGRYEIALELLAQEDEPAAAKFDSLYKHETE